MTFYCACLWIINYTLLHYNRDHISWLCCFYFKWMRSPTEWKDDESSKSSAKVVWFNMTASFFYTLPPFCGLMHICIVTIVHSLLWLVSHCPGECQKHFYGFDAWLMSSRRKLSTAVYRSFNSSSKKLIPRTLTRFHSVPLAARCRWRLKQQSFASSL